MTATSAKHVPHKLLGFWTCLALVVGTLVGSGIYGLPAQLAPFGWNALFGWLATIAGALCLAYIFAALARELPRASGPYAYAEAAFGRPAAFAVGWSYWISLWVGNAAIAVTAISYLSGPVPALAAPGVGAAASILLLWLLTALNCFSLRASGGFQLATAIMKLIPLLLVVGIGAAVLGAGGEAVAGERFDPGTIELGAINGAAAVTLWALLGFEAAAWASRNVRDPARNIPRATIGGVLIVALLYLLVTTLMSLILPASDLAGSEAPIALFVERFWGSGAGIAIALFGAVSVSGALNGLVLLQGELPLAMARDGAFPTWFARLARNGRPVRAQIVSSILTTMLILANGSATLSGLFAFMALLSTAAILVLYFVVALAAIELQRRNLVTTRPALLAAAMFGTVYALWTFYGAGLEASGWALVLIAAGLPVYIFARRQKVAPDDFPGAG
ncbi:MAG TPA: amino acid permease [Allosphingosinicella sp.]